MNNVIGLKLTAVTNAVGVDISATGRQAAACAGCHYQGPFALDLTARILTKRVGTGATATFVAQNYGPQTLLGGQSIADDAALVAALVNSDSFRFRTCRLAFQYLYGRAESQCEAPLFEQCVQAFNKTGTIQAGLAAIAKDKDFCQ
jgi:hypothetical protein